MKFLFILITLLFSMAAKTQSHVLFRWPLTVTADYDDIPNYFEQSNFVDDFPDSGLVYDYTCGNRTYDGHRGVDISLYPFWWNMMDNKYVVVVAAAAGIVDSVSDNFNNDHNCGPNQVPPHNVIVIRHSDGSTSWYYHIMDNSALVQKGDSVYEGQPIASPGSSGASSNPHLHFEVHDALGFVQDPYYNASPTCNTLYNSTHNTWWKNQRAYWEPQINRVMTHSSLPSLTGYNGNTNFCPGGESVNAKNNFLPGDNMYIGIALRDMLSGSTVVFTIYDPSGLPITTGSFTNTFSNNLNRAYFPQSVGIGIFAAYGTYKLTASYQGYSYSHYYTVGCTPNYSPTGNLTGDNGFIAGNSIVSDAVLSNTSRTLFQSANVIQLNPGFTATQGCVFKARIRDCNYSE